MKVKLHWFNCTTSALHPLRVVYFSAAAEFVEWSTLLFYVKMLFLAAFLQSTKLEYFQIFRREREREREKSGTLNFEKTPSVYSKTLHSLSHKHAESQRQMESSSKHTHRSSMWYWRDMQYTSSTLTLITTHTKIHWPTPWSRQIRLCVCKSSSSSKPNPVNDRFLTSLSSSKQHWLIKKKKEYFSSSELCVVTQILAVNVAKGGFTLL